MTDTIPATTAEPANTVADDPPPAMGAPRAFRCRCGRPVFFRNSMCLSCGTPLGYDPTARALLPIEPDEATGPDAGDAGAAPTRWRAVDAAPTAPRYRRCSQLDSAAACNWLVEASDAFVGDPPLCRSCRLTRTLPDLSVGSNAAWWSLIELAKRRLVSSLIGLGLPVVSKVFEDAQGGLAFDVLSTEPQGPPVITGHAGGVITVDIEEADDLTRESRRNALQEPYRTLLGHLRHESGHYYWHRLVEFSDWLLPYRALFGDERDDYAAALQRHYAMGSVPDWRERHVSAYASCHPWEDWAETWAHYLHMVDTLDTASSFGLDAQRIELGYDRYTEEMLDEHPDSPPEGRADFIELLNAWVMLTGVLNELSRSIGVPDFYPFVLSAPAVRKLHCVHCVVHDLPATRPLPAGADGNPLAAAAEGSLAPA